METKNLKNIRQSIETLTQNADTLLSQAGAFPAILQNTKRLKACIRMMEIALGQTTSPLKNHPDAA